MSPAGKVLRYSNLLAHLARRQLQHGRVSTSETMGNFSGNSSGTTEPSLKSTYLWWRHPPFRGLLERVGKLDEPWLAAGHSGETHANGAGFALKPSGKGAWGWIRHQAKWHDDRGIARLRRNGVSSSAWK